VGFLYKALRDCEMKPLLIALGGGSRSLNHINHTHTHTGLHWQMRHRNKGPQSHR